MLTSFLITFRESLEAALIVGIILGYLLKTKQTRYNNLVYLSIGSGIFASVIFAIVFSYVAGGFEGLAEQLFEGITMLVASVLLTFMILWMMKQKHIALHYHKRIDEKIEAGKLFGLFMIGFISILREGVETVIFLNAARFASGPSSIFGALLGVAVAIVLGYIVFVGSMKVSLKKFFNVTSIMLVLFAAGLVAHAGHEFQEAGFIPLLEDEAWNLNPALNADGSYPLLHERGTIGSILAGLLGYNGDPSIMEVMIYVGYLLMIYLIYRKIERSTRLHPNKSSI